ncbi:hypothetical protein E4U53_000423 [Claviceps sorghi]|nr:hypothetical protein E4U53_000423 [Claviceps sorghi]
MRQALDIELKVFRNSAKSAGDSDFSLLRGGGTSVVIMTDLLGCRWSQSGAKVAKPESRFSSPKKRDMGRLRTVWLGWGAYASLTEDSLARTDAPPCTSHTDTAGTDRDDDSASLITRR